MPNSQVPKRSFSLSRWSRRKLEATRTADKAATLVVPAPLVDEPASPVVPHVQDAAAQPPQAELPAVDSLTFDSDFTAFLQPNVDESLRRQALKKLFADPRFNVMDGLDVYIDDYGKPDPIEPELVRQLVQARYLFDPPRTRVNEHGLVEDVPPDAGIDAAAGVDPGADANAALPGLESSATANSLPPPAVLPSVAAANACDSQAASTAAPAAPRSRTSEA